MKTYSEWLRTWQHEYWEKMLQETTFIDLEWAKKDALLSWAQLLNKKPPELTQGA